MNYDRNVVKLWGERLGLVVKQSHGELLSWRGEMKTRHLWTVRTTAVHMTFNHDTSVQLTYSPPKPLFLLCGLTSDTTPALCGGYVCVV